jgi:uncharacterized protein (TIGR02598 family)
MARGYPKSRRAFSLVEVVIALAVAAFALITVLALLPVGLNSANSAVGDTRSSMIAQDVLVRLRSIPGSSAADGISAVNPPAAGAPFHSMATNWFYDGNGLYLGAIYTNAVFRVDATRGPLNAYPPNTNPSSEDPANAYSSQLQAAVVTVGWPVNTATGTLFGAKASTNTYTFYLRPVPNS